MISDPVYQGLALIADAIKEHTAAFVLAIDTNNKDKKELKYYRTKFGHPYDHELEDL